MRHLDTRGAPGRIALQEILNELNVMARGLNPSILFERGLAPGRRMISNRGTIPVELDLNVERRPGQDRIAAQGGAIRLLSLPGVGTASIAEVPVDGQ